MLFAHAIQSWEDWADVYQSIPAFAPLIQEIFRREDLPFSPLSPLTPGTNAVFRSGELVVKVFFPKESGLDPEGDFQNEGAVCRVLTQRQVPVPRLLAAGHLRDRYTFPYLVTQFCPGEELGQWLPKAAQREKLSLSRQLFWLLEQVHQEAPGLLAPLDLRRRALENFRLEHVPASLARELTQRAEGADLSRPVLVHGDLTGENVLVSPPGGAGAAGLGRRLPGPAVVRAATPGLRPFGGGPRPAGPLDGPGLGAIPGAGPGRPGPARFRPRHPPGGGPGRRAPALHHPGGSPKLPGKQAGVIPIYAAASRASPPAGFAFSKKLGCGGGPFVVGWSRQDKEARSWRNTSERSCGGTLTTF